MKRLRGILLGSLILLRSLGVQSQTVVKIDNNFDWLQEIDLLLQELKKFPPSSGDPTVMLLQFSQKTFREIIDQYREGLTKQGQNPQQKEFFNHPSSEYWERQLAAYHQLIFGTFVRGSLAKDHLVPPMNSTLQQHLSRLSSLVNFLFRAGPHGRNGGLALFGQLDAYRSYASLDLLDYLLYLMAESLPYVLEAGESFQALLRVEKLRSQVRLWWQRCQNHNNPATGALGSYTFRPQLQRLAQALKVDKDYLWLRQRLKNVPLPEMGFVDGAQESFAHVMNTMMAMKMVNIIVDQDRLSF